MKAASFRATIYRMLASLALSAAMLNPAVSSAADWDIDQLMQSLATAKSGSATFVERKYLAMLERPVESSGDLFYTAPDRLEKRTVKPKPETMLVEGDVLVIERGRKKFTVQLQEYPALAGFIDSIRGTMAGDRKVLERVFKLKLEGDAEHWTLTLFPTEVKMAAAIQLIRIAGSQDNLRSIEIIQTDGDRSLMAITRVGSP